ncbi:Response regulator [Candidatus Zixiibacteriota bacterium]|nr:Response regulator [candidate division Zixibacteria bacterium]
MIQSVLILVRTETVVAGNKLDRILKPHGEYVFEISELYNALKERTIDLILIEEGYPGITPATIRRLRLRSPLTDIWLIEILSRSSHMPEETPIFDGRFNLADGTDILERKIKQILRQKSLLKKFNLVGRSDKLKAVAETIEKIAPTDISVLIIGPSGSGKELVARAIHGHSARSEKRFVEVNCGALAEGVLESELFGHEKGAFTGSVGKRGGLFVQADGGSIFLDEIVETKPDMQVKLLRVLEDGYFYPVGSDKAVRSNTRVIAATNRDLNEAIREGTFREDLYFRLGVIKINLPPLLERSGDILPLLCHFAAKEKLKGFSEGAIDMLLRYDWPGNVRQLRNFVARMGALHPGEEISIADVEQFITEQGFSQKHLPVVTGHTPEDAGHELIYRALLSLGTEIRLLRDLITANLPSNHEINSTGPAPSSSVADSGSMQGMEKELIANVLRESGGNRKTAARKLGIGERTLYRKLKRYNLS